MRVQGKWYTLDADRFALAVRECRSSDRAVRTALLDRRHPTGEAFQTWLDECRAGQLVAYARGALR